MTSAPNAHERLLRIRQLLRRRLRENGSTFWDDRLALHYLARAYARGLSMRELEAGARAAATWSRFFGWIDERLDGDQE